MRPNARTAEHPTKAVVGADTHQPAAAARGGRRDTGDGTTSPIIEFESFSLTYPENKTPALQSIDLRIRRGERVLLLGPSGCGKSSLLNVVLGLVPGSTFARTEGVARVFGESDTSAVERAGRLAAVFQDPDSQLCMLTVEDEVAFGLENINLDPRKIETRIAHSLRRVGLAEMRRRRVDRLSGGQKQRLVLACAMAVDPEILVLDEPCSNLDSEGVAQFARTLAEQAELAGVLAGLAGVLAGFAAGKPVKSGTAGGGTQSAESPRTVFLVEHRIDSALESITRVVVLDSDGRLRFDGEPQRVFGDHAGELARMGVWVPTVYHPPSRSHHAREAGEYAREADGCVSVDTGQSRQPAGTAEGPGSTPAKSTSASTRSAGTSVRPGAAPEGPAGTPAKSTSASTGSGATPEGPASTPAGRALLEMRDVRFAYERGTPIFSGVSFDMYGGETVAVLGANGSGKTTLAKLACGLLRPSAGRVLVSGRQPHRIPARELPGILGYVFQNPEHQFVRDSVREEVAFTLERPPLDAAERDRRVEETLRRLSLSGLEARNPFSLSHGQKRRLSAATMLVAGAPLIAFDEPTFGQDYGHLLELERMFDELARDGVGLLIITHDTALARRHADRILSLPSGEILPVEEAG